MRWFDPIESKWHDPPEPHHTPVPAVEEDNYTRGKRIARERRIMDAITATAQASQQGERQE